jgi:hypothetical protein
MIPSSLEYSREYVDKVRAEAMQVPEEGGVRDSHDDPWYSGPSHVNDEGDAEPIVLASLGGLMVLGGLWILVFAPIIGGGFVFIGIMMIVGSIISGKLRGDRKTLAEPNDEWYYELSALNNMNQKAFMEAMEADSDLRLRSQMRRMKIEEVVKAVKTTIRVRCRYCGTLNEEKAKKCESCGGLL